MIIFKYVELKKELHNNEKNNHDNNDADCKFSICTADCN